MTERSGKKPEAADVTPWFSGEVKPFRKGLYQRATSWFPTFSYWNGTEWGGYGEERAWAYANRAMPSGLQAIRWRGLRQPPLVSARKRGTK